MKINAESINNTLIKRPDKNVTMTMRQMRVRINKKKLTKKNNAKKKFSVVLTKEEIEEKMKYFRKIYGSQSSYQICLQALRYTPFQRTVELNNMISYYLRNLTNFRHILSGLNEEEFERVLLSISTHLTYEKYNQNEIICKYGEKAEKYYIIIKGKVVFLIPEITKYYMNEEDYIEHLMKLREIQEIDLLKNIISINQYIYYINVNANNTNNISDFDEFICNILERHEKNKENKYSDYLYLKIKEYKNYLQQEKNNNNDHSKINKLNGEKLLTYEDYIQLTNYKKTEKKGNVKISKRKIVNILEYKKTNIYSDGDTFGSLGVSNKKGKRTATCICYDNCHLGILTKNEYIEFLDKIYEKANDKLYDLIMKNNIFENMLKSKFELKYSHMFRFIQYNKNNIILNEKEKTNKLIILYEGEFALSVNANLFELNEIIVEYKKIKIKLSKTKNHQDEKNINDEIEENKKILINMKNFTPDINEIIKVKNNFILSNINNSLILGYPNTVNPETNLALINCKCVSKYASAYLIEKEMLKYIDQENNNIRQTPDSVVPRIDLILKRLYELKALIMKKIKDKNLLKKYKINISEDDIITRNLENKNSKKNTNTLVDFTQKIISPKIIDNNLILSQSGLNNMNNKYLLTSDFKKDISFKEMMLNKAQYRSQKFLTTQKNEFKKFTRNANKIKDKEKYKDLAIIFSDKPHQEKTILDKFKESTTEDNVLDPQIKKLKKNIEFRNKIKLKIITGKDPVNNEQKNETNDYISNTINKTCASLYNAFHENNKIENKLSFNNINDTFSSFYTKNTTLIDLKNSLSSNFSGKNIHTINLNDRDVKCFYKNYQDSYNELYYKYIFDKFKNEKSKDSNELNIDGYKTKRLNSLPNKYIFPSISPFTDEKIKKKENLKKYKYLLKFKNVCI